MSRIPFVQSPAHVSGYGLDIGKHGGINTSGTALSVFPYAGVNNGRIKPGNVKKQSGIRQSS
jgi:hypothetical protein